jgi:hypothetical protein
MARRRYFIGQTQEWLEAQLSIAQADLAGGTTNTGGSEGDSSFQEQVGASPQERIDMLLWDLFCLDPSKYPREDVALPRVTRGVFRG